MPAEMPLGDCWNQNAEANWYALYTCSRHEKRVAEQIERRRAWCFLPSYRSVRRWKDRRKELDLVLFSADVFVRMKLEDRSAVLQLPGVVRVVSFDGRPAAVPEGEIERLRGRLSLRSKIEPHPYLRAGRRVRVRNRSLEGPEEIIVRRNESCRLVFSIDVIQLMSFSDQSRSKWMRVI